MVTKNLLNGASGNLGTNTTNDTVTVLYQATDYDYTIHTSGGDDTVNLKAANKFNTHYVYTGEGDDTVFGVTTPQPDDNIVNVSQAVIYDGAGNDKYYMGKSDIDWFQAGAGNDIYDGGGGKHDQISFEYAPSDDFAQTNHLQNLNIDLNKITAQALGIFGSDKLLGIEDVMTGSGNDRLTGNAADNLFDGNYGNDFLRGKGGTDSLTGGDGKDTLIGDSGVDRFYLDENTHVRDIIKYFKVTDSGKTFFADDQIYNFDKGGGATNDKIDISAVAHTGHAHFSFVGTHAISSTNADGEVHIKNDGFNAYVQIDTDKDAAFEFEIWVSGGKGLKASDFIL